MAIDKKTIQHSNKRIVWIDIAKGLGIIFVVLGHSEPPEWIRTVIGSFHMPLFFFLSGIVYNKNHLKGISRLKKDFVRLIIPYLVTVSIIGLFFFINQLQGKDYYYNSLIDLCKSILFGSGTGYNGTKLIGAIWFFLALFWSRRILDVVFDCNNIAYRLVLVGMFVGTGITLAAYGKWAPMSIDIAFVAVGFVYVGWLVQQKPSIMDDNPLIYVLILICIVSLNTSRFTMSDRNYYNMWFISIPGAIALSMLICKFSKILSRAKGLSSFLTIIGRHSLLFICVHDLDWRMPFPRFGQSIIELYKQESWYWVLSFFHRFCFDLFITIIIVNIFAVFRKHLRKNNRQERFN